VRLRTGEARGHRGGHRRLPCHDGSAGWLILCAGHMAILTVGLVGLHCRGSNQSVSHGIQTVRCASRGKVADGGDE
jgi:hypothetical protein